MNILCTVCVRAGSKGLRDKNFLKIKNRYLLSYTLDVAQKSKLFKSIVVSTDSKKIRTLKKYYKKISFINRPKKLATDQANKMDAIRHALKSAEQENTEQGNDPGVTKGFESEMPTYIGNII